MDLHEIVREGSQWANEQNFGMAIRITNPDTDPDPYHDTGKTCLGGGMRCASASSSVCCVYIRSAKFSDVSLVCNEEWVRNYTGLIM